MFSQIGDPIGKLEPAKIGSGLNALDDFGDLSLDSSMKTNSKCAQVENVRADSMGNTAPAKIGGSGLNALDDFGDFSLDPQIKSNSKFGVRSVKSAYFPHCLTPDLVLVGITLLNTLTSWSTKEVSVFCQPVTEGHN